MKVFISHSGISSYQIGQALNDWLPRVIQAIKPFFSPDIEKGANWSNKIDEALEGTRFGIVCLTPDNLKKEWIHYEAGALSKTKDASVWTFLLELNPADVKPPLSKFQHTIATDKSDVLKLVKTINAKLIEVGGEPLKESLLEEIFDESWTKLEARLNEAKELIQTESEGNTKKHIRSETDKIDEVLEILRGQQRHPNSIVEKLFPEKIGLMSSKEKKGNSIAFLIPFDQDSMEQEVERINQALKAYFPNAKQINVRPSDDDKINCNIFFREPLTHGEITELVTNFNSKSYYKIGDYITASSG